MKQWTTLATAMMLCGTLQAAQAAQAHNHTHDDAGAPADATATVRVSNPELLAALKTPRVAMEAERTPLAFDNGASAKNCLEYSDLLTKGQPAETTRNFEIRSEYLLCDSLRPMAGKPFSAEKKAAASGQAKALYEKLDLRSFPSSLRNRADDAKHTLKTLLPGTKTSEGAAVAVETQEQHFRLEVVATIDHGKGSRKTQEWIVWVTDELKNGTYRSYTQIVVNPPRTATGPYTAAATPR
ncbi:hypothetical protein [Acidovorax sp. SUPP3334]|uniref:hypothetical protein n=1 Tax=Acidovorax sp. SUPP3334 TaxID=2920881 RepID=UPI0023DE579D|nr:hypothetical protein [Acidovorax sp. SUPP3334]GKT24654.1 hypothetical protein AVHM3334_15445 [Acidovorax sp. SUPP3334]